MRKRRFGSKSFKSLTPGGKKKANVGQVGSWQHVAPGHRGGAPLARKESFKYLGMLFHKHMSMARTSEH
eukprot:397258-Pelagomonas_calceolata.AAC.1